MARACRFLEYSFSVDDNGSIKIEDLEAAKLDIKPGDTFLCFVDPDTQEVTMKKFDLQSYDHVQMETV